MSIVSSSLSSQQLQPAMLPRAIGSIPRRIATTCMAAARSRVPAAAGYPRQLSPASLHGVLAASALRHWPTSIGYRFQHAAISIAPAATATTQPTASGITPAAYSAMVDRLKDMASQFEAQDQQTDPLSRKAQAEALKKLCPQLANYLQASGADLSAKKLVQHAGILKKLHQCMGPAAFANSPAKDVLYALVDAAVSSPAMQDKGPTMLTSWSMLLHSLAPCHASAPNMQQLLKTAMDWYRSQGPDIWARRVGQGAVQPATISLTLWAFATCSYKGDLKPLVAGINAAAVAHALRNATDQEWCTTVWAAAKLGMTFEDIEPVWRRAGPAITASVGKGRCNPQDISMAMYAAATSEAKFAYRQLTAGLRNMISLQRWDKQFHDASPQATATILLALSKMMPALTNPEWVMDAQIVAEKCIASQTKQLKQMTDADSTLQSLITTVLSMAGLRMFVSKFFTAVLATQLDRIPSRNTGSSPSRSSSPSQDAAPAGSSSASSSLEAAQESAASPLTAAHGSAAWKAWTLDSVTILYSCAQVYPGLAHGLQLMLAQQALKQQAAGLTDTAIKASAKTARGVKPAKSAASAGLAKAGGLGQGQGEGEEDEEEGDVSVQAEVLEQLHAQVQEWLKGTYSLMAKLETSTLEDWDSQALTNFLWAWAALLPSTFQYGGLAVQQYSGGSTAVQEQGGQPSQGQAGHGSSQQRSVGSADHPAILQMVAAVFQECSRRGPKAFTEQGLTQIFTAHCEAKERNLTALGAAALDPSSELISAAQTLWRQEVQARSNTNTSKSQHEVFKALSDLGYKVEMEALTPSVQSIEDPSGDSGVGNGGGVVGGTGAGKDEQQIGGKPVGNRSLKPIPTSAPQPAPAKEKAATTAEAAVKATAGQQEGQHPPASSTSTEHKDLEPMRVDMLITALPDGTPCCMAVEFDGPSHFMVKPRHMYTGASALRHRQVQRRVDRLVVIKSREWAKLNRGVKGKEKQQRHKVFLQHRLQQVVSS